MRTLLSLLVISAAHANSVGTVIGNRITFSGCSQFNEACGVYTYSPTLSSGTAPCTNAPGFPVFSYNTSAGTFYAGTYFDALNDSAYAVISLDAPCVPPTDPAAMYSVTFIPSLTFYEDTVARAAGFQPVNDAPALELPGAFAGALVLSPSPPPPSPPHPPPPYPPPPPSPPTPPVPPPSPTPWYDNPYIVYSIAGGGSFIGFLGAGSLVIVLIFGLQQTVKRRRARRAQGPVPDAKTALLDNDSDDTKTV